MGTCFEDEQGWWYSASPGRKAWVPGGSPSPGPDTGDGVIFCTCPDSCSPGCDGACGCEVCEDHYLAEEVDYGELDI